MKKRKNIQYLKVGNLEYVYKGNGLSEESPLHYNCFIDRAIRLRFRSTSVTLTITCSWSFTTSEGSLT